jgi:hypothetical protein
MTNRGPNHANVWSLACMNHCRIYLGAARQYAAQASRDLQGASAKRADELVTLLEGCQCHADRLALIVEGDAFAELYDGASSVPVAGLPEC